MPNIMFLRVDKCEGDDIVGVLTNEVIPKTTKITAISNDKDFYQLMVNRNYKQYDPIKKKIIECLNPNKELEIKILTGDKSDNIPAIKYRVGVKTATKINEDGIEKYFIWI